MTNNSGIFETNSARTCTQMRVNYILRLFLVLVFWAVTMCAQADEIGPQSQSSPPQDSPATSAKAVSVLPGPLEQERLALLTKIQEAKANGVGIQNYMTAFMDLEHVVQMGTSQESIRARLDSIELALTYQLSHQEDMKHLAAPFIGRPPVQQSQRKLMSLDKARLYILGLVNADRAKYHLSPLTLDAIASAAGQMHTDEMVKFGYCRHWDMLGRKPWQRYSEAGGTCNVGENLCFSGGNSQSTDHLFSSAEIESLHVAFMDEKPPDDGHRLQILRPEHNKLGVGLSCSVNAGNVIRLALAQEFIDDYGEFSKLPNKIVRGKPFEVSGSLFPGWKQDSIVIRWEPEPKPMTKEELDRMPHSCSMPAESSSYDSKEDTMATMKVWTKDKRVHFSVRLTPDESWKSGLYYVLIWAGRTKDRAPTLVSTETTHLE
jgi:uncharacterized protein YkwD